MNVAIIGTNYIEIYFRIGGKIMKLKVVVHEAEEGGGSGLKSHQFLVARHRVIASMNY